MCFSVLLARVKGEQYAVMGCRNIRARVLLVTVDVPMSMNFAIKPMDIVLANLAGYIGMTCARREYMLKTLRILSLSFVVELLHSRPVLVVET